MEGIANGPEAVSLQSLMVTVSPTTSYFKESPLTCLTPPNSNKTTAAIVAFKWWSGLDERDGDSVLGRWRSERQ